MPLSDEQQDMQDFSRDGASMRQQDGTGAGGDGHPDAPERGRDA